MSDLKTILSLIEDLEDGKLQKNNAEIALREISANVLKHAQETIDKANTSDSIDAKIDLLAKGLSDIVSIVDAKLITTVKENKQYDDQIKILETLLTKIDKDQKKNEASE